MIYYEEIYTFQKIKRVPTLSGGGSNFPGGPIFTGGIHLLIYIETYIACDFQGGGPDHYPPFGSAHVIIIDTKLCTISSHVFLVLKKIVPLRRFF